MERCEKPFDMRSVVGDGYELSKEINCKIDALLMPTSTAPVAPGALQVITVGVETLVNDIREGWIMM